MWEEAANEFGCVWWKCVGLQHSFLSEWQKLHKGLEAGLRVFFCLFFLKQTRNIFFPDGHCKIEKTVPVEASA